MRRLLLSLTMMALGLALFAVSAELTGRVLPVSTATAAAYRIDPMILTYPAHTQVRMATGWDLRNAQTLRTNNLGFVGDIDFLPDERAVAVIGDSYIESSMLPAAQRVGHQLQGLLGDGQPVYAMGTPGAMLLDYAQSMRYASQKLQVRDFVVFLSRGDIRQSVCTDRAACLDPGTMTLGSYRRDDAGAVKQVLRESALAQYLFSQLRVSLAALWPAVKALPASALPRFGEAARADPAPPDPPLPNASLTAVALRFFNQVQDLPLRTLVFVVNSPLAGETASEPDLEIRQFGQLAQARGHTVVDMAEAFKAHAQGSKLSLHVGPYDHHLNGLGLGLVAQAAADGLRRARQAPVAAAPQR